MFLSEKLLEDVKEHLKSGDIERLSYLIQEIDEINKCIANRLCELYIEFDNVGNGGNEFDPYETFSVKIKSKASEEASNESIVDELSLDQLDCVVCALLGLFEESDKIFGTIFDEFKEDNEDLRDVIIKHQGKNEIVWKDDVGINAQPIESFTKQPINGQLYDLNRLPEVILSLRDENWDAFSQRWVNDISLVQLLKFYYNRCQELESKLNKAEEKVLTSKIMK